MNNPFKTLLNLAARFASPIVNIVNKVIQTIAPNTPLAQTSQSITKTVNQFANIPVSSFTPQSPKPTSNPNVVSTSESVRESTLPKPDVSTSVQTAPDLDSRADVTEQQNDQSQFIEQSPDNTPEQNVYSYEGDLFTDTFLNQPSVKLDIQNILSFLSIDPDDDDETPFETLQRLLKYTSSVQTPNGSPPPDYNLITNFIQIFSPDIAKALGLNSSSNAVGGVSDDVHLAMIQDSAQPTIIIPNPVSAYSTNVSETALFNLSTLPATPISGNVTIQGQGAFNPYMLLVGSGNNSYWVDARQMGVPVNMGQIPSLQYAESLKALGSWNWNIQEQPFNLQTLPVPQNAITGIIQFGVQDQDDYSSIIGYKHPGMDFIAPSGTPVLSLTPGRVVGIYVPTETQLPPNYAYVNRAGEPVTGYFDPARLDLAFEDSPNAQVIKPLFGEKAPGGFVVVRTGKALVIYGHLDPASIQVGSYVQAGQPIAAIGDYKLPGDTSDDHLHLELRVQNVNPISVYDTGEYAPGAETPSIAINPRILFNENLWTSFVIPTMLDTQYANQNVNPNVVVMVDGKETINQNTWAVDVTGRTVFQTTPTPSEGITAKDIRPWSEWQSILWESQPSFNETIQPTPTSF